MTHDELLAKMKELSRTFAYEPNLNFESALRAVVELATTYQYDSYVNEEFDQGLQTAFRLVIQAIEKELE